MLKNNFFLYQIQKKNQYFTANIYNSLHDARHYYFLVQGVYIRGAVWDSCEKAIGCRDNKNVEIERTGVDLDDGVAQPVLRDLEYLDHQRLKRV